MKKLILFTMILSATTVGTLAKADFNTAAKNGKIKCSDSDGSTVTIDKNRSTITVHISGNEGADSVYTVQQRQSDGDTFVSYSSDGPQGAVLSFSDRGDSLDFNDTPGEGLALSCN